MTLDFIKSIMIKGLFLEMWFY